MSNFYQQRLLLILCFALVNFCSNGQTGNRVFTGSEMVNFGTLDLATPAGKTWTTDRSSSPGYFGATNGASFSNASDANNIDGYVKKYGNQAFTFPVGNGADLRTLSISAPTAATDAYATAWILGNPSGNLDPTGPNGGPHDITKFDFPIRAVNSVGQWDWQAGINMGTTGDGVNLMITVSIPDMTAFANANTLRLVGWNGSKWIDLSGMATATGNTKNSTMFGYMQAGISAVAIGTSYWILPLKLISFTAQEKECAAALNWTTTNEENMSHFEIEQSDDGGNSYKKIGRVNASGNSNETTYTFTANQSQKEGYYRLKMIAKDGNFTYSFIQHLKIDCKSAQPFISIYPNPVTGQYVNINFTAENKSVAKIIVFNANGQQVKTQDLTVNSGSNYVQFYLGLMPKGIYFIQIISSNNKPIFQSQKIIVE